MVHSFRYYYVEPPSYETSPEGEDSRRWFTSRDEADKEFNFWVRKCRAAVRDAKENQRRVARGEALIEEIDDFRFAAVELGYVLVTPTKAGILRAFLTDMRVGKVVLRSWPTKV